MIVPRADWEARAAEFFCDPSSPARREALEQVFKSAVLLGDVDTALRMYADWKISNRVRFPFAGGRAEQPAWVLHNLDTLAAIDAYYALKAAEEASARDQDNALWGSEA